MAKNDQFEEAKRIMGALASGGGQRRVAATMTDPGVQRENEVPAEAPDSLWSSVLEGALEGGTKEGGKELVAHGLAVVISGVVAGVVASSLVEAASALLRPLFDRSESIARDLKLMLDEPFRTATRTLSDIGSVDVRSADDLQECYRQLVHAFDNLAKARSYAEQRDPARVSLICFYQCLTAALMPGGRPFADLYLREFRTYIAELRGDAARLRAQSDAVDLEPFEATVDFIQTRVREGGARFTQHIDELAGLERATEQLESRRAAKEALMARAGQLEKRCDELEVRSEVVVQILATKSRSIST